jgi:hypothetical protein
VAAGTKYFYVFGRLVANMSIGKMVDVQVLGVGYLCEPARNLTLAATIFRIDYCSLPDVFPMG